MTTSTDHTDQDLVRAATREALRACAPAVTELGLAMSELRSTLPPSLRPEAERVFMNAFGNAVWEIGRGGS